MSIKSAAVEGWARVKRFMRAALSTKVAQTGLFVASIAFGLIIRPALTQLFAPTVSTVNRALGVSLLGLMLALLVALDVALTFHLEGKKQDDVVLDQLKSISRSLGIRTLFFHEGNREPGSDAYSIVRDFVAQAKHELLILDYFSTQVDDHYYDGTSRSSPSRVAYYAELTEKACSRTPEGGYFRYKRIIQMEGASVQAWPASLDRCLADHIQKVLDCRSASAKAACSVKTSKVFYPNSSIAIADGERILLELAIADGNGQTRVEGDLVFQDPDGALARPLVELISHIDTDSVLVRSVDWQA